MITSKWLLTHFTNVDWLIKWLEICKLLKFKLRILIFRFWIKRKNLFKQFDYHSTSLINETELNSLHKRNQKAHNYIITKSSIF